MNPFELVVTLAGKGVRLSVEGGDLKCRGPKSALTPETLAQLKAHKAEVLERLTQPPPNDPVQKADENLGHWLKRVRDSSRRLHGEEPEPRRRPPDDEPPRRDPQPTPDDRPRPEPPAEPPAPAAPAPDDRPLLSPLAAAMLAYLRKNPNHAHELPGWLGTTCWAYGYHDGRPTPEDSKAAVEELRSGGYLTAALRPARGAS